MHRTGNAAFDGCHGQVETRIGTAKSHHNMIVIFRASLVKIRSGPRSGAIEMTSSVLISRTSTSGETSRNRMGSWYRGFECRISPRN